MFRKFKADKIFTGSELLEGDHVLITGLDGRIEAVVDAADAGEDVEYFSGWLSPGFINAHCHLDLSHLKRKMQPGEGLPVFIRQVMAGRDVASTEVKNHCMLQAMDEMHRGGIVAVGDICTGTTSLEIKKFSALQWVNFIEVTGMSAKDAPGRWAKVLQVRSGYEKQLPDQQSAYSPHAPYSVSPQLMQIINSQSAGEMIAIHNQECSDEDLLFLQKSGAFIDLYKEMNIDVTDFFSTGQSSFKSWTTNFNKGQRILSVHNTETASNDIEYAKNGERDGLSFFFCLCPRANLFIENKLPPVKELIQQGVKIILGTDSLASNEGLSILEEMKVIGMHFHLPPELMLAWATMSGAEALGLAGSLGSFEKGKKPGIVRLKDPDDWERIRLNRIL